MGYIGSGLGYSDEIELTISSNNTDLFKSSTVIGTRNTFFFDEKFLPFSVTDNNTAIQLYWTDDIFMEESPFYPDRKDFSQ